MADLILREPTLSACRGCNNQRLTVLDMCEQCWRREPWLTLRKSIIQLTAYLKQAHPQHQVIYRAEGAEEMAKALKDAGTNEDSIRSILHAYHMVAKAHCLTCKRDVNYIPGEVIPQ